MIRRLLLSTFLVWAANGCAERIVPPEFDGTLAFRHLEQQVTFGPRVPGTPSSALCRTYCYQHFVDNGFAVDSQRFVIHDPYTAVDTPMVNVIARYRGDPHEPRAILLMAHYDSRPRTDYHSDSTLRHLPIDGANDGASGVAVLLELARLVGQRPPKCNLDLVLCDGEDWGESGDLDLYLLGSKEFARQGIRDKYRFAVVIDMVGDKFQQIFREEYTERYYRAVNNMIWKAAADIGVTTFVDEVRHTIQDDHLSLGAAGVPTALLIDFDYPYWHTERDTPDKCSAGSLAAVGKVLASVIYNESLWPRM